MVILSEKEIWKNKTWSLVLIFFTGLATTWTSALVGKATSLWTKTKRWVWDHWAPWKAWPRLTGSPLIHRWSWTIVGSDSGFLAVLENAWQFFQGGKINGVLVWLSASLMAQMLTSFLPSGSITTKPSVAVVFTMSNSWIVFKVSYRANF